MKILIIKSKKHGIKECYYDSIHHEVMSKFKWGLVKNRKRFYAVTKINGKMVRMHKLIVHSEIVDHRDGNGLNNLNSNLRSATNQQNLWNRGPNKKNSTGFKGVIYSKKDKYYYAVLTCNKKTFYSCSFKNAIDAATKYNEMALTHHGEFAYQNPL